MHILKNVINFSNRIGISRPKVAVLSATEEVLESVPSSLDAAEITKLAKDENLEADVFGPLAFDNSISKKSAGIDAANNLVELFLKRADENGDKPFLGAKRQGSWQTISWREAADRVCILAESLRDLGLVDGDRVALVSENRPEWCIADLGIMAAGCITVPAYTTNTERDHQHILDNSGAKAVIVSTDKLAKPLIPAIFRTGIANHIIPIDEVRGYQGGNLACHGWSQMISGDAAAARGAVDARLKGIGRGDTACIIYTSGTGGAPRGVLQHHGAILCNVAGAGEILVTPRSCNHLTNGRTIDSYWL